MTSALFALSPARNPLFQGPWGGHNHLPGAARRLALVSVVTRFACPPMPTPPSSLPASATSRSDPARDRRLVDAALAGQEQALHELAKLLAPVIQTRTGYALLRRRGHYQGDARARLEDLVQDTFVELFRDGGRVLRAWDERRGMSLASFAGLVAEQRVYAFLRNRKASARLEELDGGEDDGNGVGSQPDDRAWDPESRAASREQLRLLLDHLRAELSPAGRVLFERLLVNEEAIAQVASEMGMSVSAVQAWSSRLKRRAAALLDELSNEAAPARPQVVTS